ncbi:MAG: ABC transporter permease [Chitinophagaceae bacterium]
MFSHAKQYIIVAFQEIVSNRLRSFLSLLGITIGVFCIISVLTVVSSLKNNIQTNMQSLGSNVLYVGKFAWIPEDKGEYPWWKYKSRPVNTLQELKMIEKKAQTAAYSVLSNNGEQMKLSFNNRSIEQVEVFAMTYHFNKVQPIDIEFGRYFSQHEMTQATDNNIVLGHAVSAELFGNAIKPVGKQVMLNGRRCNVIGVLKEHGKTMTGFDYDNAILMSYLHFLNYKKIDNQSNGGFIDPVYMIKTRNGISLEEMKYEIKGILRAYRKLKPSEPDNFSFNQLDTIQNSINDIFASFSLIGWIIGLFSLLVGGFGIANIMFVSVKERTRYIGIKKSIGAKQKAILSEFLMESVILCLIGGLLGIALVFLVSLILSGPIGFPVTLSLSHFIIGVGISVFLGLVFGYIPAKKASSLNPVEAIRS